MDISEIETLFGKVDINNNFIKVLNENTDKIDEDLVEKLRSIAKSSVEDEETLNFFKTLDSSAELTFDTILEAIDIE